MARHIDERHLNLKRIFNFTLSAAILGLTGLLMSCGYQIESNILPRNFSDPNAPTVTTITPLDGSKIDGTLKQIVITYSEAVDGADTSANYVLSGSGVGSLSIGSVTESDTNTYTLSVSGTPGDGTVVLTIQNIADLVGNALTDTSFNYIGWWDTNWTHRRKLTFDNSSQTADLVDFPVLVKLNSSRIDYSGTMTNGEDIRFLDPNRTELPYEIEKWDASGESDVWVKVPQIDGASSTDYIWMYYGNTGASDGQDTAAVWSSTYDGVWHFNEASGGPYADSTGNGHNGTAEGTIVHIDAGAVGGAVDSDAGSDRIAISIAVGPTVTISTWAKADTTGDMLWCLDNDSHGPDLWFNNDGNIYLNTWDGAGNPFGPQPTTVDQWHYYTSIISSSETSLYIDGQFAYSATYKDPTTAAIIYVGSSSTSYTWDGSVDEFRIANQVKSADWIAAQYKSMDDSFITFGSEE